MKSLRISALMLALGAFSVCSFPAHAQQEVDPDHFDQPRMYATQTRGLMTQSAHNANAQQHTSDKKPAGASSRNTHRGQSVHHSTSSQDTAGK